MIKAWGFEFFYALNEPDVAPKKVIDYFNFYLDLWVRAEALGYEGVFLSEHHFGLGYSPSPNLLLPLIAQRTKTLRIGVMGMVVPYHNAWRLVGDRHARCPDGRPFGGGNVRGHSRRVRQDRHVDGGSARPLRRGVTDYRCRHQAGRHQP